MGKIKIKNNLLPCSAKHQIFIIKKQEIFKPKKNDHVAALFGLEGVNGKLSPSYLLNIHNIRKSHTRFQILGGQYPSHRENSGGAILRSPLFCVFVLFPDF
jgi:hypothetical protein